MLDFASNLAGTILKPQNPSFDISELQIVEL